MQGLTLQCRIHFSRALVPTYFAFCVCNPQMCSQVVLQFKDQSQLLRVQAKSPRRCPATACAQCAICVLYADGSHPSWAWMYLERPCHKLRQAVVSAKLEAAQ